MHKRQSLAVSSPAAKGAQSRSSVEGADLILLRYRFTGSGT